MIHNGVTFILLFGYNDLWNYNKNKYVLYFYLNIY